MTPLKFHPEVYQDIADAYNWYQQQLDGLGDDFINELEAAYSLISQMPQSWAKKPAVFCCIVFRSQ